MAGILNVMVAGSVKLVQLPQPFDGNYMELVAGSAGIRVGSDGNLYKTNTFGGGAYVLLSAWKLVGAASDYSVRVTITGGSPGTFTTTGGGNGVWTNVSANLTWTRASGAANVDQTVTYTIEIARTADTATVLASATGTLTAQRYT